MAPFFWSFFVIDFFSRSALKEFRGKNYFDEKK
jgi:hypothetical protein